MKNAKKIGIWMDYSIAHIMGFITQAIEIETITSKLTHPVKESTLIINNEYYKKISDIILNYTEVILFGPTSAKMELFNNINEDERFSNINFIIRQTDMMNGNQRLNFVNDYFQ